MVPACRTACRVHPSFFDIADTPQEENATFHGIYTYYKTVRKNVNYLRWNLGEKHKMLLDGLCYLSVPGKGRRETGTNCVPRLPFLRRNAIL